MKHYDCAILGAGIVGLLAANLLAKNGFTVAVIDNQAEQREFHPARVSAINAASQKIFEALNIWMQLAPLSTAFIDMEIWDQDKTHRLKFSAIDDFKNFLGFIVPNQAMYQALLSCSRQEENIDLYFACQPEELGYAQCWQLKTNQMNLSTSLMIGADGAHSWLRQKAHFVTDMYDYQQSGLIATVKSNISRPALAWQRFYQKDVLAFLPIRAAGNEWAIVWSRPLSHYYESARLISDLQNLTQNYFGELTLISSSLEYPLKRIFVKNPVQPGMVLIGDAAHTIHPLAGQGVNFGMADALCLTEVLAAQPKNIADYVNLKRYQRARSIDVAQYRLGIDFIKSAFSSQNIGFNAARGFAIAAINKSKKLKNVFMQLAAGKKY